VTRARKAISMPEARKLRNSWGMLCFSRVIVRLKMGKEKGGS
jgi:hypothetical protein